MFFIVLYIWAMPINSLWSQLDVCGRLNKW
jgi:hypothetical protein